MLQRETFFRRPDPQPARNAQPASNGPAATEATIPPKPAEKTEERKEAKLIVGPTFVLAVK